MVQQLWGGTGLLRTEQVIEEVCRYIEGHLTETINVNEMARSFGYSHVHLNRLFKEIVGRTISQYIRNLKVEQAKLWLRDPDMTITEIAYRLGYLNSGHFSRMFQTIAGTSPTNYRRNAQR